jgi:hypothetical protein
MFRSAIKTPKPFVQIYLIAIEQLELILRQRVEVHHYVQYSMI